MFLDKHSTPSSPLLHLFSLLVAAWWDQSHIVPNRVYPPYLSMRRGFNIEEVVECTISILSKTTTKIIIVERNAIILLDIGYCVIRQKFIQINKKHIRNVVFTLRVLLVLRPVYIEHF